jgi:hypothetical protein
MMHSRQRRRPVDDDVKRTEREAARQLKTETTERRRELRAQKYWGCTWDQYVKLDGLMARIPPIRQFIEQRTNARQRGIRWELTLWQWWLIWQQSGFWQNRGPGAAGYCMCRLNDVGPYAVDNVYIATGRDNVRDYWVNRRHAMSFQREAAQ